MATLNEIDMVWSILCVAYPQHVARMDNDSTLAPTLRLYEKLLADVPGDVLEAAALHHISLSQFFPTIAELRQAAFKLSSPCVPSALEAWGQVKRLMATTPGLSIPAQYPNPIAEQAVRALGGWRNLCMSENEPADRARFCEVYNTLLHRSHEERCMLPQVREVVLKLTAATRPALVEAAGWPPAH